MSDNPELDNLIDGIDDDDMVEIDMSDAGDDTERDFKPFAGARRIRITRQDFKHSQSNNNPMFACEGVVIDEQNTNRRLWFNLMLNGKGVFMARQAYEAAGIEVDWTARPVKVSQGALVGVELIAICKAVPAQGTYKAKVDVNGFRALPDETAGVQ